MIPPRAAKVAQDIRHLHRVLEPTELSLEQVEHIVMYCAPAHLRGLVPAIRGALQLAPPPPSGALQLADACEEFVQDHPRWSGLLALPHATRDPLARFLARDDGRLPLAARGLLAERLRSLRIEPRGDRDPTLSGYSLGVAAQYLAADGHAVELLEAGDYPAACEAIGFEGLKRSTAQAYRAALRQTFELGVHQRVAVDTGTPGHPSSSGGKRDRRALLEALLAAEASPGAPNSAKGGGARAPGQPGGLTALAAMRIPRGVRPCPPQSVASVISAVRATDVPRPVRELLAEVLLATYLTGWPPAVFDAISEGRVAMDPIHDTATLDSSLYSPEVGLGGLPVKLHVGTHLAEWLRHALAEGGMVLDLPGHPRPLQGSDLETTLEVVNRNVRHPVWLRDLRGALWFRGRPSWTSSHLVLATTAWDRAFRRPFYYLAFTPEVDLRSLQDVMYAQVSQIWRSRSLPRPAHLPAA